MPLSATITWPCSCFRMEPQESLFAGHVVNNGATNYSQPQEEAHILPAVNHPQIPMDQSTGYPSNLRSNIQPMINVNRQNVAPPPGFENGSIFGTTSSSATGYNQVDKKQCKLGKSHEVNNHIQSPPGSQRSLWPKSGNYWYKNDEAKMEHSKDSDEFEPSTSIQNLNNSFLSTQGTSWRTGQEVPQSNPGMTPRELTELQHILLRDRYYNAIDNRHSSRLRQQEEMSVLSQLRDLKRWEALRNTGGETRNQNERGF